MAKEIIVMDVRLAFANLFALRLVNGEGTPRTDCVILLEPDSDADKLVRSAINEVATEEWQGRAPSILAELDAAKRLCFTKKPREAKDGTVYSGFDGMHSISASAKIVVPIVDGTNGNAPLSQQDGRPYGGCYVNAGLQVWAQDNKWGKRINCELRWVQFVKDGDAFGGAAPVRIDQIPVLSKPKGAGDIPGAIGGQGAAAAGMAGLL